MRWMALLGTTLLLAGCGSAPKSPPKDAAQETKDLRNAPMPEVWKVLFDTSRGSFVAEIHKDWAPRGAERFWKLVNSGFFSDTRIFRVRRGFIVQFGLNGDPQVNAMWNSMSIDDDPVKEKNVEDTLSFAQAGKNSRRTQVFVNLKNNPELDSQGFAPIGKVILGKEVFAQLYSGYGEWNPPGQGPRADLIVTQGNAYLDRDFPRLDRITRAKAVR